MGDGDDNPKVMPIKRRLLAKVMHLYQTAWYQPGRFEGPAEAGGHEGTQMWKLRFLKPPQSSRDPLQSKLPCRDDAQHLEQVESRELPAAWRRGLEVLLADGKRVHVHVEIGPRTESIANAWNPLRCCVKTNCHGKDQDFAQYNEKSNRYHQAKSPFASIFTVLITTLVVEDAKVEEGGGGEQNSASVGGWWKSEAFFRDKWNSSRGEVVEGTSICRDGLVEEIHFKAAKTAKDGATTTENESRVDTPIGRSKVTLGAWR